MTEVHVCPVCEGKGIVPWGFYSFGLYTYASDIDEICKSCKGTGYLIINTTIGGYK